MDMNKNKPWMKSEPDKQSDPGEHMPTTQQRLKALSVSISGDVKIWLPDLKATVNEAHQEGLEIHPCIRELVSAMIARKVVVKVNNTIGHWDDKDSNIYPWGSWRSDMTPMEYYRKEVYDCPKCCTSVVLYAHGRPTWYDGVPSVAIGQCTYCAVHEKSKSKPSAPAPSGDIATMKDVFGGER